MSVIVAFALDAVENVWVALLRAVSVPEKVSRAGEGDEGVEPQAIETAAQTTAGIANDRRIPHCMFAWYLATAVPCERLPPALRTDRARHGCEDRERVRVPQPR